MAENSDIGTAVGTFDTIDVDSGQIDNYRLVNSANGMFRINANALEVGCFYHNNGIWWYARIAVAKIEGKLHCLLRKNTFYFL